MNEQYGGAEGLCDRLDVDPIRGLPKNDFGLERRRAKYGRNTVPAGRSKTFWRLVFDACRVIFKKILWRFFFLLIYLHLLIEFFFPQN